MQRHGRRAQTLRLGNAANRFLLAATGGLDEIRDHDRGLTGGARQARGAWQTLERFHIRAARDEHEVGRLDGCWSLGATSRRCVDYNEVAVGEACVPERFLKIVLGRELD